MVIKGAGYKKSESAYGLIKVINDAFPKKLNSTWDTDPALCDGIVADQLNEWIFKAEEFLIAQGFISNAGINSEEALHLYLERIDAGKIDGTAVAYKLVYDSRMARQALLASVTALSIPRNAHKACYHILHATLGAEKFWLLKEEKVIQDGRKTATGFRNAMKAENSRRKNEALGRYRAWQKSAKVVWKDRPDLSASAVAEIIKKRDKIAASVNTIRLQISKS